MELKPTILQKLNEIGIALSKEHHIPFLHEKILRSAKDLTHVDGGTIYSVTDAAQLHFEIVMSDSLHFQLGGTSSNPIPFADLPLFLENGEPNDRLMVAYAANHKATINIEDAYYEKGYDFSGTRRFDEQTGYRTKAVLTIPMKDHEDKVIAVLQLINPIDPDSGEVGVFTEEDVHLAESLASQAGIALTNQILIQNLRKLFESLIHMIAEALDDKSPTSGKHEKRVPIVTEFIAKAVNKVSEGPLKETHFTEEQLYELQIAALLHDCGKITTPEYLVAKKTKLETIYDPMQTIEARFACLMLQNEEKRAELEEDLAFVQRCNEMREPISDEAKKRLARIAAMHWRGDELLLTDDELEHLLIPQGNLSAKERTIIQHHVVMTHRMLLQLPFPKEMSLVPEIAASHHERIDGKGYPRGLKGDEMLIQAKILVIADVFEALSSPDRSYRKPAPLSEVFKIMQKMVDEGHIDPDLFDAFLKQKAYLQYAKLYLTPEQLDLGGGPGLSLRETE